MSKNKFQSVDFKTVEDFLEYLPETELKIVSALRKLVFACLPDCTEKLSYNVPYYSLHSRVCFIWPGSIGWGNSKHEGVRFGFANGYLLNDAINYLDKGGRKQVYWKDFLSVREIDVEVLKSLLFEAMEVDERVARKKRR